MTFRDKQPKKPKEVEHCDRDQECLYKYRLFMYYIIKCLNNCGLIEGFKVAMIISIKYIFNLFKKRFTLQF